ncbi:MAG: translation initiation factor IF-3, partial [Planctomycetales bacterium]|nr:translation initiation factor IF-3 [Planctomycetales bacterium]
MRVTPIRVISNDGEQLGIIPTEEAMNLAREAGLDLVEVAPNEKPPVCRIMDYGKFKYQQKKRQHKGHVHQTKNKEIRLRPKIGEHDLDFKLKKARGFLEQKDKVVLSVVFRGRENAHTEEGFKVVKTFIEKLGDLSKPEMGPSMQGRRIVAILAP